MKIEFEIFEKYSNIKFHENPFSGSWVVPSEQMNMTKVVVSFCNFANVPKNLSVCIKCRLKTYMQFLQKKYFKNGYCIY